MFLLQIFDRQLGQYAYLIGCKKSKEALLIDPERDIDRYQQIAKDHGLHITAVAETHIHADFISGAQRFACNPEIKLYLSCEGAPDWLYRWPKERPNTFYIKDGDFFLIGTNRIDIIHTPGHTPEHICYVISDLSQPDSKPTALITGDFLFVGSVGRPDLLESAAEIKNTMAISAQALQRSLQYKLSQYDDALEIYPGHGAGSSCGKQLSPIPKSTLGQERHHNRVFQQAQKDGPAFIKDILEGQPDPPLYFKRMKLINRDGIANPEQVFHFAKLSSEAFVAAAHQPNVNTIDVRNLKTLEKSFSKAIHVPLHTPLFSSAIGSFCTEKDKILLIIDRHEDIAIAEKQLYRIGLDQLEGWINADELDKEGWLHTAIPTIDFTDFNPTESQRQGTIVDVRTTAEYLQGHLPGALSLPYTRLKEHLQELPRDRTLYVHCQSGIRATAATTYLRSQGYPATLVKGQFRQPPAPISL